MASAAVSDLSVVLIALDYGVLFAHERQRERERGREAAGGSLLVGLSFAYAKNNRKGRIDRFP